MTATLHNSLFHIGPASTRSPASVQAPRYNGALLFVLLGLCTFAQLSYGQALSKQNFRASVCNIADMQINFKFDESFGEPLLTSQMKWQAGPNTSNDCLSDLTQIWLSTRLVDGSERYVRIGPNIKQSGQDFAPTVTESPSWQVLFCRKPSDTSGCENEAAARMLYSGGVVFEKFTVTTEAQAVSNLDANINRRLTGVIKSNDNPRTSDGQFSLESLLDDVIDNDLDNTGTVRSRVVSDSNANTSQIRNSNSSSFQAAQAQPVTQNSSESQADQALSIVVSLLADPLADYTAPAHKCESERTVHYSVKTQGQCQVNFRSESNHHFTCGEANKNQAIATTRRVNIDLTNDLSEVSPVRVSNQGWASMVLELNDELHITSDGDYRTDRWQFVANADHKDKLQALAGQLLFLKQYCEN